MILQMKKNHDLLPRIVVIFFSFLKTVDADVPYSYSTPLDYEVTCGSQPVKAALGDNVTLPCWVCPNFDATEKTVEWSRLDQLQDSDKFVLVDKGSRPDNDQIIDSFIGRVTLCYEDRRTGNVSLNITNVNVSDSGWYKCFLPHLKKYAKVQLVVSDGEDNTPDSRDTTDSKFKFEWWHGVLLSAFLIIVVAVVVLYKNRVSQTAAKP